MDIRLPSLAYTPTPSHWIGKHKYNRNGSSIQPTAANYSILPDLKTITQNPTIDGTTAVIRIYIWLPSYILTNQPNDDSS